MARQDYGAGVKTLSLCPPTPNCIATSEELNDQDHYVPAWWAHIGGSGGLLGGLGGN